MFDAGRLGAALEQLLGIAEELLLPGIDHLGLHAVQPCQLVDRLVTFHRRLRFERRWVGLTFRCHDLPFLGQPIVTYSTVQFLGSTTVHAVIAESTGCHAHLIRFRCLPQKPRDGCPWAFEVGGPDRRNLGKTKVSGQVSPIRR
jgi:hypothetical protein